jgi:hypothetical protein
VVKQPFAWLVPYCPDFYFMPSLRYHQLFKEWDDGTWNCPAYWTSIGLPVIPCFIADGDQDAQCWISLDRYGKWQTEVHVKRPGEYSPLWLEALECSRRNSKQTETLRFDLSSPVERELITKPLSSWRLNLPKESVFRYKNLP